jgi:hypothetical protein
VKIAAHLAKADRIGASLARCTTADFETVIEGCMLAGTHLFNLLLHDAGLRREDHDAMHSEFIGAGERRRIAVRLPGVLEAMDAIESLRTGYVRGDLPGGEAAAGRALAALAELRRQAAAALAPRG